MSMPNKRQAALLDIIRAKSSVYVNDLIAQFDVSAATIRKDLTALEDMQLVQRTHGEVHILPNSDVTPIEHRSVQNIEAKQIIARLAASMIEEGASVILDSGSTTCEIARLLTGMNSLTVITNSLPVATILANSRVVVLMPGGMLLGENLSTQGPDAERYYKNLEVDIAFLAASGVRPHIGLASQNPMEYSVKQAMMRAGRHVCAVVDSSKFEKSGVHLFARFEEFDTVITEKHVEGTVLEQLASEGKVQWLFPEDA